MKEKWRKDEKNKGVRERTNCGAALFVLLSARSPLGKITLLSSTRPKCLQIESLKQRKDQVAKFAKKREKTEIIRKVRIFF